MFSEGEASMQKLLLGLVIGSAMVATTPLSGRAEDRKVYDRDHKDYHQSNDSEHRAYQHWWREERHEKEARPFNKLRRPTRALTGNGGMNIRTGTD
jgi:hypothetical protein